MNNTAYSKIKRLHKQMLEDLKEARPEAAALLEYAEQQMQEDSSAVIVYREFLTCQGKKDDWKTLLSLRKRMKMLLGTLDAQKLEWADASWQYSTRIISSYVQGKGAVALSFSALATEYILLKREAGK